MTALARLEAHLRRAPEDEASWRVHADHLLDRGERRGELVGLADIPDAADRLARLEHALRNEWLPALQPEHARYTWKHGFPVALGYRIEGPGGFATLDQLLADPRMRLCGRLTLQCFQALPVPAIAPLARVRLANIVEFAAEGGSRGNAIAQALARNATVQLASLSLIRVGLGNTGVRALLRCKRLRGLTELTLYGHFDADALAALLASPLVERLERLALGSVDVAKAKVLAAARLDALRRLDIAALGRVRYPWPDSDHDDDGAQALAEMRAVVRILAGSRTLSDVLIERFRSLDAAWDEWDAAQESSP